MRPFLADRRGYIVGLSSMLVGSALAWWSASATWVLVERSLLGDSTSSEMTDVQAVGLLAVSGGSVVSIAAAAPIIGFAGVAGVIGSRGWLRRVVGVVVAIAGIALCISPLGSRWKWRSERSDGFDGVAGRCHGCGSAVACRRTAHHRRRSSMADSRCGLRAKECPTARCVGGTRRRIGSDGGRRGRPWGRYRHQHRETAGA